MKINSVKMLVLLFFCSANGFGQSINLGQEKLEAVGVSMSQSLLDGKRVVQVVKDPAIKEDDAPTFVKLVGSNFKDGSIEVMVYSKLHDTAPPHARGFIGVAFRINSDNSKFECIYIRPTNGRVDDQVRRNHTVQYFSFPDFKFSRLRKESPEKYESYADIGLSEWIKMKIVISGDHAKLYLNDEKEPTLIVNDLKHGADNAGAIGLFVDVGTEGYFADLKVLRNNPTWK